MSRRRAAAVRPTARPPAAPPRLIARAARLRERIARHDHRYYVLDRPTISDAAYDALTGELAALERRYPDLATPGSPTARVAGRVRPGFRSVRHRAPLLSLESTTDDGAVRQFDRRVRAGLGPAVRYVLEPKFDGLSVEVVYARGMLVSASTRGDGERGEDVTANVRSIGAVPVRLRDTVVAPPRLLAVRGEVVMRRADFAALNRRLRRAGQPLFANPRNAAAGSVRQLDARITAGRALRAYFYDILAVSPSGTAPTASGQVARLRAWGLPIAPRRRTGASAADILAFRDRLGAARASLPIEIDGIVAKVDALAGRRRLGSTARHPRWALGVKFAARSATTRLERLEVQVGRTGTLTPVAVLRPVGIGGVTISRATLHNFAELARRRLRAGDLIEVARAGDVIPEIVGRAAPSRGGATLGPPRTCPACHARVVRRGPHCHCPNSLGCPAQRVRALQHFASRDAFDIAGLGPRTVRLLVEHGLIRTAADLFALTDDDLRAVPHFGAVAARRLARAIAAARRVELARFLVALGIPDVGVATARRLADRFGTLAAIRRAGAGRLAATPGVGRAAGARIGEHLRRRSSREAIAALLRRGVRITPPRHAAGPLAGRSVVFTGRLTAMTRDAAERLVARLGGRPSRTVTRATSLVVAGMAAGAKYHRARTLGVPVISESEFLRRVRTRRPARKRR